MAQKKPSARRPKKSGGYDRWLITGIVVGLIIVAITLWGPSRKFRPVEHVRPAPVKKQGQSAKKTEGKPPVLLPVKTGEKMAVVAIVIDDLGQDMKPARELLALHDRITFAVMPGLTYSRKIAQLAGEKKREVLLHLPMEPKNRNGKRQATGTLRSDMTPMEFMTTIREDIESVPAAVGVNNHEGSALTENREAMKFLMTELQPRNVFFLDSLTNPKSVAYATAKEFGLKAAKRDVFLDNEEDNPEYIHGQLEELARIAKKRGRAIGIGHPHPVTISELRKWLGEIKEQGIEIVPVSQLVK
jgi:polysaccharide deacetylase 2 family uncharacterized protein YibQ